MINEIYYSLQGESRYSGYPMIFIRTMGCSLRCSWCDSEYTFTHGSEWETNHILSEITPYPCSRVLVTGGEPLDQKSVYGLLSLLCDTGYQVLLETSGHQPLEGVDPRVEKIMDLKCPSSKMSKRNRLENLDYLTHQDEVKFVIGTLDDYHWAVEMIHTHHLLEKTNVLFSPVHHLMDPQLLAKWILEEGLPIRLQLQLHKILWGSETTGV